MKVVWKPITFRTLKRCITEAYYLRVRTPGILAVFAGFLSIMSFGCLHSATEP